MQIHLLQKREAKLKEKQQRLEISRYWDRDWDLKITLHKYKAYVKCQIMLFDIVYTLYY